MEHLPRNCKQIANPGQITIADINGENEYCIVKIPKGLGTPEDLIGEKINFRKKCTTKVLNGEETNIEIYPGNFEIGIFFPVQDSDILVQENIVCSRTIKIRKTADFSATSNTESPHYLKPPDISTYERRQWVTYDMKTINDSVTESTENGKVKIKKKKRRDIDKIHMHENGIDLAHENSIVNGHCFSPNSSLETLEVGHMKDSTKKEIRKTSKKRKREDKSFEESSSKKRKL